MLRLTQIHVASAYYGLQPMIISPTKEFKLNEKKTEPKFCCMFSIQHLMNLPNDS